MSVSELGGMDLSLAYFTVKEYLLSIKPTKDLKFALFKLNVEKCDL